nr:DNA-(apurinic or apyrimidinic site) lyase, chloroplastic-like [Zootoca vivipara]XP_034985763.1 DNA-(apurinic or apyrimidinic site) lyase, chloroplastic-like [Zootoca vivipara]
MNLKVVSWNVNGLNNKLNKVEHILKKGAWDVICLQETHVANRHKRVLENKRLGEVYTSLDERKKRGVATYVKKNIKTEKILQDGEGRMVGTRLHLPGGNVIVINIYAPNGGKSGFFRKLRDQMSKVIEGEEIILTGDFNGVWNAEMDRTNKERKSSGELPKEFRDLAEEYELKDGWRIRNPKEKKFSHYSDLHKSAARLDMVWLSANLMLKVTNSEILPKSISDHNPVMVNLKEKEDVANYREIGDL